MKNDIGDTLRICECCGVQQYLNKAMEREWWTPDKGKSKHGRKGDAWGNPWYCSKCKESIKGGAE